MRFAEIVDSAELHVEFQPQVSFSMSGSRLVFPPGCAHPVQALGKTAFPLKTIGLGRNLTIQEVTGQVQQRKGGIGRQC